MHQQNGYFSTDVYLHMRAIYTFSNTHVGIYIEKYDSWNNHYSRTKDTTIFQSNRICITTEYTCDNIHRLEYI